MLGMMALMLISGPLAAWSSGNAITVFGVPVISGATFDSGLFFVASTAHHFAGLMLAALVVLHIAAALKHMAVNKDGTIEKIVIPGARPAGPPPGSDADIAP
jgi:cytochrome b561